MSPSDDRDEIDRAASQFVQRYGLRAVEEALQRARELEEAGDQTARRTWLRIAAAAEMLLHRRT